MQNLQIQVKDVMVRFVVMISEATQFTAIQHIFSGNNWEQQTSITKMQARYVVRWGQLSLLLVESEQ
ncbi:ribosome inactivating protein precursor [Panicum miliaceum]|uniref:Ribosome inactivating protein n=1 Tax=Panicum miliaceum TaxID=4540 RepID=A0A3L6PJ02_PANMI|nr:ribosome inactivating protein precursor [Panicum miliaceum]